MNRRRWRRLAGRGRSRASCCSARFTARGRTPLVIRALMRAFGLSGLALEWPEDLASVAGRFQQARGWPITRCCGSARPDHRRSPGGLAGTCRSRAAEPDIVPRDHEHGLELVAARRSDGRAHPGRSAGSHGHLGCRGPCAHPHGPYSPRRSARRAPGGAAAGPARDPDQLRRRTLLQHSASSVPPPSRSPAAGAVCCPDVFG